MRIYAGAIPECPLANSVSPLLLKDWPRHSETAFGNAIRIPDVPRRQKVHVVTVTSLPAIFNNRTRALALLKHKQIKPHRPIGDEMELYQIAKAANAHILPIYRG